MQASLNSGTRKVGIAGTQSLAFFADWTRAKGGDKLDESAGMLGVSLTGFLFRQVPSDMLAL